MTESISQLIEQWRAAEDVALQAASYADELKRKVVLAMTLSGEKSRETALGKVTLVESTKCNIVVDRKEFETTLKRKGLYDRFCTTKFDLNEVKRYVESQDDDLYGMVELEKTASPRFTPRQP